MRYEATTERWSNGYTRLPPLVRDAIVMLREGGSGERYHAADTDRTRGGDGDTHTAPRANQVGR
jgi:hypothetical protein